MLEPANNSLIDSRWGWQSQTESNDFESCWERHRMSYLLPIFRRKWQETLDHQREKSHIRTRWCLCLQERHEKPPSFSREINRFHSEIEYRRSYIYGTSVIKKSQITSQLLFYNNYKQYIQRQIFVWMFATSQQLKSYKTFRTYFLNLFFALEEVVLMTFLIRMLRALW